MEELKKVKMNESDFFIKEGNVYKTKAATGRSVLVALFGVLVLAVPFFTEYGKSLPSTYQIIALLLGVFMILFALDDRKSVTIIDTGRRTFTARKTNFFKPKTLSFDNFHSFEIRHLKGYMVRAVFREGSKEILFDIKAFSPSKEKEMYEFIDEMYGLMGFSNPLK